MKISRSGDAELGTPLAASRDVAQFANMQDSIGSENQSYDGGGPLPGAPLWFAQRYPFLTTLLAIKRLPVQATYTIPNVARLLNVSTRAIQDRTAGGQLQSRDLPGRAKFFPDDLEEFLRNSKRKGTN